MRLKNKKGISPLIATVLLVGFTITLGALAYLWLSGTLELQAKKGEAQCSPNDLAELQFTVPKCTVTGDELRIQVNNQGNKRIDGFWVSMQKEGGGGITPLDVHNVNPGKEETIELKGAQGVTGVELIPVVIEDSNVKTCSSNTVKVQCT